MAGIAVGDSQKPLELGSRVGGDARQIAHQRALVGFGEAGDTQSAQALRR